jgi:Ca-activated chloride channel homolog
MTAAARGTRGTQRYGSRGVVSGVSAILLCVSFAAFGLAPQQQPPPAVESPPRVQDPRPPEQDIELSANLVTVTVAVRDASGKLVTDLKPEDFVVSEDGVPQEIEGFFREREVPLRLALLFDASISIAKRLEFERRAANKFFSSVLRAGDQAALFSISTDWKLEQGLTDSPAVLAQAGAKIKADGITSLFDTIGASAKYLGSSEGRRVIVILSDGNDTGSRSKPEEALADAQHADAVVYGICSTPEATETRPLDQRGQQILRAFCKQTGGSVFVPPAGIDATREAAELDAAYAKLIEELRSQYVLTYYSNRPANDGTYRKLRVEARRPGLTVAARSGYYAK